MSLSQGPQTLAIPGPSIVPERVLRAMHRASPNIYTGALVEMTRSLVPDLRRVARTDQQVAMYIGNGHTAWEAALANTHSRGDRVLVPLTGAFGRGWVEMAEGLGLEVETLDFGTASPIDAARVGERLRADRAHEIRSVLVVHVDTSTSLRSDLAAIRREIDAAGHPALLQVDAIASLGCDRIEMDAWGVDVLLAGSQKGLMLPPGLSFNAVSAKAIAASKNAKLTRSFWDWAPMIASNATGYFPYTPATNMLYALDTALDMIFEEGLDNVFARHDRMAEATRRAVRAWGLEIQCAEPRHYSSVLTAVRLPEGHSANALRATIGERFNMSLGNGLGQLNDRVFRIGHLGDIGELHLMGTLSGIEMGLRIAGVPHKPDGVRAAMDYLSGNA